MAREAIRGMSRRLNNEFVSVKNQTAKRVRRVQIERILAIVTDRQAAPVISSSDNEFHS